ncbi:hypothetical protein KKF84_21035 [Myxococcota bacterium]|nr:hypothetical protein [Myxococcota bacterium]MBU1537811.1 hypothetical protein [Myxococcota bacterium]
MAPMSPTETQADSVCTCGKEILPDEGYTFNERVYCAKCYFKESKLGPLHDQYKKCGNCQTPVHIFTIKCPQCHQPVHETGTISVKKPIRTSVILTYGIIALIIVVTALTMPTFSDKGFLAWFAVIPGMLLTVHGLLGLMFFFLPFGFKTFYRFNAFLIGLIELGLGGFLVIWPKL